MSAGTHRPLLRYARQLRRRQKDPRERPILEVCSLMRGMMGIFFLIVTLIDRTESGSVDCGRGRNVGPPWNHFRNIQWSSLVNYISTSVVIY